MESLSHRNRNHHHHHNLSLNRHHNLNLKQPGSAWSIFGNSFGYHHAWLLVVFLMVGRLLEKKTLAAAEVETMKRQPLPSLDGYDAKECLIVLFGAERSNSRQCETTDHGELSEMASREKNLVYKVFHLNSFLANFDKSGPNGFTFEFFQKYWKTMGQDIVAAVTEFFSTGKFPPGCNSTFIALIPKIHDAKTIKDFRPISLIGSIYKIIAKIMANHLSLVISDLIYEVQIAYGNRRGG
ncbi:hypothetical protein Tco_1117532 [Tanacetum coccineum]